MYLLHCATPQCQTTKLTPRIAYLEHKPMFNHQNEMTLRLLQVNLLSKVDLVEAYGQLAFNLDFYTEVTVGHARLWRRPHSCDTCDKAPHLPSTLQCT